MRRLLYATGAVSAALLLLSGWISFEVARGVRGIVRSF